MPLPARRRGSVPISCQPTCPSVFAYTTLSDGPGHVRKASRKVAKSRAWCTPRKPRTGAASSHVARIESVRETPSIQPVTIGPRGVTRTSSTTASAPRTGIVSTMRSTGSGPSGPRTSRPSDETSSQKRSAESVQAAVMPQAALPLKPVGNAGLPTNDAPASSHSGVRKWARYHGGGTAGARCGSFARIGTPDAVRDPAMAHAFDPPAAPTMSRSRARSPARRATGSPARAPAGVTTGSIGPYVGSTATSAAGPSATRMAWRASSVSQLPARASDWRPPKASTSSIVQALGRARRSTSSCGRGELAAAELIPAT